MYIHQRENWFNFVWDNEKILPILATVRHLQGRLLGHMERLGFDLIERATLESDRKSTRLNSSHEFVSRMPSSA